MKFEYLNSYNRSFKKLPRNIQKNVSKAISQFIDFILSGQKPEGLGLKKLYKHYWEIRVGLSFRILFELKGNLVTFILVGDHNQIEQFLKTS